LGKQAELRSISSAKPNVSDFNDINMDEVRRYRSMADFYHQYNVLVLSSFSLQYAIEVSHDLMPVKAKA